MRTFMIAVRNLLRNTRRTALTLAAIAFGLTMVIVGISVNEGAYESMVKNGIAQMAGHVVITAPGWQEDREDTQVVTGSGAVAQAVAGELPDAVVARRIALGGLLMSSTNSVGAALQGVEPGPEAQVVDLDDQVVEGTWLDEEDDRGIVLGKAMADSLGVQLGDRVVYMGQHGQPEMVSRLFRVKGIFRSGAAELDGFVAVVPLVAAQELLEAPDAAHQITVHLPSDTSVEAKARIVGLLDRSDLDIRTWTEALPELHGMIEMDRQSTLVMLGVLLVIVAMGVLNTVLMSTLERTREFGVMLAVGMRPARVGAMVLAEGLALGIAGATLGVLGGGLMYAVLARTGVDYTSFMGGEQMEMGGVVMSALFYPRWSWGSVGMYAALMVAFTLLSAAWPAWRTARLAPVEAMRHV